MSAGTITIADPRQFMDGATFAELAAEAAHRLETALESLDDDVTG